MNTATLARWSDWHRWMWGCVLVLGLVLADIWLGRPVPGLSGKHLVLLVGGVLAALVWLAWLPAQRVDERVRVPVLVVGMVGGCVASLISPNSVATALPAAIGILAGTSLPVLEAAGVAAWADEPMGGLAGRHFSGSTLLGTSLAVVGGLLAGLWRGQYRLRAEQAELAAIQTQRAEQEHIRAQVLDERARIAREIHDILTHTLGGLVVQLDAADALLSDGDDPAGAAAWSAARGGWPSRAWRKPGRPSRPCGPTRSTCPRRWPPSPSGMAAAGGSATRCAAPLASWPPRPAWPSTARPRRRWPTPADTPPTPPWPSACASRRKRRSCGRQQRPARRPRRSRRAAGRHRRRVRAGRDQRAGRTDGRYPARRPERRRLGSRADGASMSEDQATVRVVVADDQRVVREGLVTSLSVMPGVEVVGAAADGEQAVALVSRHRPQVVLMDLRMPRLDGVEATRRIRQEHPATAVVVLTTYADDDSILAALRAGALGYLTKDAGREQIARALHAAAEGQAILDPAVQARLVAATGPALDSLPSRPLPDGLTAREAEVLALIAAGRTNTQIAAALVVSPSTVKTHINNIFAKTGVTDRAQAVRYAYHHGLADPGDATQP